MAGAHKAGVLYYWQRHVCLRRIDVRHLETLLGDEVEVGVGGGVRCGV